METTEAIKSKLLQWREDPVLFARERLHVEVVEPEQKEILETVRDHKMVSIRSGHGIGKTAGVAYIAYWWLLTRPKSIIVCTAPSGQQIRQVLWREFKQWHSKGKLDPYIQVLETRIDVRRFKGEWSIVQRTAKEPEAMAGFHSKYLMIIIDEASGIKSEMGEVLLGATTEKNNRLIMIGNPTQITGFFYDSHHKDRDMFKCLHFNAEKSKRVSKDYIKTMAKKYGKESDVYRVRVLGEFPKGEPNVFIPLWMAETARNNDIKPEGDYSIGVDPARYGNDSTQICYRRGAHVFPLIGFHGIDTRRTCGEVAALVKQIRKNEYTDTIPVRVDETGIGAGVVDSLKELEAELNMNIISVNFGAKAENESEYANLASEMFGQLKNVIEQYDIPFDDEELTAQVCTRRYGLDAKGRIQIEKKDDYKKRVGASPDKGDALLLACTSYSKGVVIEEDFIFEDIGYINDDGRY